MLTQCYLGELYKRGSLPVPAQLLPRPEAIPARPGAGGHFAGQGGGWAGADGLRRQDDGRSGTGGHFAGQGGGWQGENGCGGGGRVSGGSGCTGRGPEEGGRAGSRREDDDSTRASDRGTGSRRQESEWAGADGLRRQDDGRSGTGGHFAGQGGGWQGENGCGGGGRVSGGSGCTGRGPEEGGRAGSRREDDDSTRASNRGTGSRRQESEWAGADDLRRQESEWAGADGLRRQEGGRPGAGGHFAGQGGGWQGENRGGGGGRAGYEGSEREAIGNDARLDPGTAARIAKAARWLTGDHRPGLLLYGTVGSGKSTLARAICELIGILHDSPLRSERLAVARTSAPELVELKAAREVRAAADSEELFARLRGAPMLLIDDLGVEATAVRSWGNCLTPVIDLLYYRYDRRLFTIVTSNLDQEAIEATYGVRIADRMAEMFDRIGHAGPSYRR